MSSRGASLVAFLLLCAAPAAAGLPLAPTSDVDSSLVPSGLPLETDGFGNVFVRFGSGKPVTLVAVRRDVPAYFVSSITPDGYLRLQNQGTSSSPLWDQFQVGRRVFVTTHDGRVLPGVVAAPNTHFRRGDDVPIPEATVDDLWVDVGAETDKEVRAMGIEVLCVVSQAGPEAYEAVGEGARRFYRTGPGAAIGEGARLAGAVATTLSARPINETFVVAWVAQGSVGGRGADVLARRLHPDRAIVICPYVPASDSTSTAGPFSHDYAIAQFGPGADSSRSWAQQLLEALMGKWVPSRPDPITTALNRAQIPVVQVGAITRYVGSPGEMSVSNRSAQSAGMRLGALLAHREVDANPLEGNVLAFKSAARPFPAWPASTSFGTTHRSTWQVLSPLVAAQGISENEQAVRDTVLRLLPTSMHPVVDGHGNVLVRWGSGKPRRAFMAHMDEIGYRVIGFDDDGRMRVEKKGGFYDWLYEGETVRRGDGNLAVVAPRADYLRRPRPVVESPLADRRRVPTPGYVGLPDSLVRVDTGMSLHDDRWWHAQLTVVKSLARMGQHRVAGRSLDDRFGCTALILALQELARSSPPRDGSVIFAFTVEEETGLKGAEGLADDLAAAGELPPVVHAVDTFVSSDTPLEDQRYGYAKLGKGMVIRAVDTGSAAPQAGVEAVKRVAARHGVPLQFGITSGGNDGQMFSRWGSVNVPLGWPLRYSHTQVETADLRDLKALARMVTELARTKPGEE